MEERWWAAECVVGGEVHAVTYEAGIVDEVAALIVSTGFANVVFLNSLVCQHGGLGVASAAAGELKIYNIVWADYAVEDLQDMFRYALCFLQKFLISDEAIGTTY